MLERSVRQAVLLRVAIFRIQPSIGKGIFDNLIFVYPIKTYLSQAY